MEEKVAKIIRELGAIDYKQMYDWKGYKVYEPIYNYKGSPKIGLPDYLLVKGDEYRMADVDETIEYMDYEGKMNKLKLENKFNS